ncbi:sce7726 family protein [Janibacter hoylei]|uniref:sce7726 family protein n=1 Tax=Janibacter hoylei TaxID=364298 RepID=UPI00248F5892|nr:sce7726 family protein [Janibacter hoylei]
MKGKTNTQTAEHARAIKGATRLFTTRTFRAILDGRNSSETRQIMDDLKSLLGLNNGATNEEVINAAYSFLCEHHRNEYVYKNLLASKIFVGRHRAANSALINEFSIGSAVADTALFNGRATAYEIKTELDSPAKLPRQIAQYYRAFTTVYVVAHENVAASYLDQIKNSPAGLISVGSRWRLSTLKPAQERHESLATEPMFNTLRVREVDATLRHLGHNPHEGPNGLRYQYNLEVAKSIPVQEFQQAWTSTIRARRVGSRTDLLRDPRLFPLRSLLAQLNPRTDQANLLLQWLSKG